MSVLAHVVLGGSIQSEPAATQALAFILNSSTDIARSFLGILGETSLEFEPGHIAAELVHEDSRPDLTIYDRNGTARAFVENKFWAGLTDAQPVSYLKDLPENPPSTLVFVVPEQRVTTVWNELKKRCLQEKLEWVDGQSTRSVIGADVSSRTLLITSWKFVLDGLLQAAHSGGHDDIRQDILQLQGLTSRMDAEAFLPLRIDEVTDQETARRLINYSSLIEDITQKLRDGDIADTNALRPAHGWYTAGRFLRLYGRFGLWLGVRFREWREYGITPLWLEIGNSDFYGVTGHFETIRELFDDVKLDEEQQLLYIPLRLKTGVERDRVVDEAVGQISQIADTLRETFPNN